MRARDSLKFLKVSRFLPRSWQQERKADTRVEGFRSIARKVQRRPEINSARKVAAQAPNISQARGLEIWKNFSSVFRVPPQKAEDENVVFKMNNSPVTFRIRASWTRRNCESNCGLLPDQIVTALFFSNRLAKEKRRGRKGQLEEGSTVEIWMESLISWWIDSQDGPRHVFQEQFLEKLPLVALCPLLAGNISRDMAHTMDPTCGGAKVW